MKLPVLISLTLCAIAIAAAVVPPLQPIPSSHDLALANYFGTNTTELLLPSSPTPTSPAVAVAANNALPPALALAGTPTTPKAAKVTQLTRPHDPEPIIILPFHFHVIENCLPDNSIQARGVYVNHDFVWAYTLGAGTTVAVDHHVRGYPNTFLIGPFDYGSSTLRFSYENGPWVCGWRDGERWRECGECRAGLWSAGGLDCKGGGVRTRSKSMDCSFIMGWKSQLKGTPL